MANEPTYTLERLAEDFELTPRTARHYIENVLPDHHKKGRGKLARYGQDTWNCFAFIQKAREEKLTTAQISGVLAELDQAQIDRVAEGMEELTIVPTPAVKSPIFLSSPLMASASRRFSGISESESPPIQASIMLERSDEFEAEIPDALLDELGFSEPEPAPRWQLLYSDNELQITHQGAATPEQREQVRLAAVLIKRILKS